MLDAVIAGAGPAGCHVAEGSARRAYKVLVIEEHEQVGFPARCTGLIGRQAFARFNLPDEATPRLVTSITIHGSRGLKLRHLADQPLARVVSCPSLEAARAKEAVAQFLPGRHILAPARNGVKNR